MGKLKDIQPVIGNCSKKINEQLKETPYCRVTLELYITLRRQLLLYGGFLDSELRQLYR